MAATASARVTGLVLKTSTRTGSKAQPDGSTRDWAMHSARILVGGEDICDVSFGDLTEMPGRGETVDLLTSLRASGGFLNVDFVGPWTDRHTAASS